MVGNADADIPCFVNRPVESSSNARMRGYPITGFGARTVAGARVTHNRDRVRLPIESLADFDIKKSALARFAREA